MAELSAIRTARAMLFLGTAVEEYLTKAGQNYGVVRPKPAPGYEHDDLYRRFAMLLAWQPKTIIFTVYKMLEIIFGTQAAIEASGARPWRVYEVNANEIIIEIPRVLISATNDNASYLHGVTGIGRTDPTNVISKFYVDQDITKELPSVVLGLPFQVEALPTWRNYVAQAAAFAAGVTEITLNATIPAGLLGVRFIFSIPGDDSVRHRGDYLAADATHQADTPTTPPHRDRVYLSGDGRLEVFKFYMDLLVRAAGIVVRYEKVG